MAEFIAAVGLISGLFTLGEAGVKMSKSLYAIGESLVKARSQVRELAQELTHISTAFNSLGEVLRNNNGKNLIIKASLLESTQAILTDCERTYGEIEESVNQVRDRAVKARERAQWAFRKAKVKQLRTRLESAKATLHLMVSILNLSSLLKHEHDSPKEISNELRQDIDDNIKESEELAVEAQLAFDKAVDYEQALLDHDSHRHHRRLKESRNATISQSTALSRVRQIYDAGLNIPELNSLAISLAKTKDNGNCHGRMYHEEESRRGRLRRLQKYAPKVVRKLCLRWTDVFDLVDENPSNEAPPSSSGASTKNGKRHCPSGSVCAESNDAEHQSQGSDRIWLVRSHYMTGQDEFAGAIGLDIPSWAFHSGDMFDIIMEKISSLMPATSDSESIGLLFAYQRWSRYSTIQLRAQNLERGQFIIFSLKPDLIPQSPDYYKRKASLTENVWRIMASRAKISGYPVVEDSCFPFVEYDESGQGYRKCYLISDVHGSTDSEMRTATHDIMCPTGAGLLNARYGIRLAKDAGSLEKYDRITIAKIWSARLARDARKEQKDNYDAKEHHRVSPKPASSSEEVNSCESDGWSEGGGSESSDY